MKKIPAPHLMESNETLLQQLEEVILKNQTSIESWFRQQWRLTPPPIYGSVDLRNAGFKLAPVDTNLFPAGFNNVGSEFLPLCVQALQTTFEKQFPGCLRILIIPENHTRNQFYFENLLALKKLFIKAGFDVRIGTLREEVKSPEIIHLKSGETLCLEPLIRQNDRVGVADFSACTLLLNNDLSEGIPPILQGLKQPIAPSMHMGWFNRSKITHFEFYQQVSQEFSELIQIDPWLINPFFQSCDVDFMKSQQESELVNHVDSLLKKIQKKYDAYSIEQKPFAVVKADAGTYGMGIMMVTDPAEVQQLNHKERARMAVSKGKQSVKKVLIQEGVYTFEKWGKAQIVAEPVVYLIGQHVVGGFYRIHNNRGVNANLNAPGMEFKPLAFDEHCHFPDQEQQGCQQNRFYTYGIIARLALVAAAREMQNICN